ncbi:MAG: response regulator [Deltaproteobacteria bacterium]|nr:response regulator [Deltaproteobacteria bacterium]
MRILVADDNRVNAELLKGLLEKRGHTVSCVENGKKGLEILLSAEDFDLIISDILMPEMDGFQFCRYCKLIDTLRHIPFIFYSGTYTEKQDEELALRLGASHFIRKPLAPAELMGRVESVMEDIRSGAISFRVPEDTNEYETYRLYSERLVNKLEKKMEELDASVVALEDEIVERKKTEGNLRLEKEFAEKIFNAAPVLMLVLDPDGRILRFNPCLEQISGYTVSEVVGKHWKTIFKPETFNTREYLGYTKGKSPEGLGENVTVFRTRDNKPRIIEWLYRDLTDGQGSVTALLAMGMDVTDRLAQHRELMNSRNAEVVNQLCGGLVHDFNNLLAVILGRISLAKDDIRPLVGDSIHLESAHQACLRARDLTACLMRMTHGNMLSCRTTDIKQLVKKAVVSVPGAGGVCEIEAEDGMPELLADPKQLVDALSNIVANSVEATGGKGSVRIICRTENETGENGTGGDVGNKIKENMKKRVRISISDTGSGISEHILPRIFDPYFSTKERGAKKGMGLGLSTAYAIIEKHGGSIDVVSNSGVGTVVDIFMPVDGPEPGPVESSRAAPGDELPQLSGRVLVMDDELALRDLCVMMLARSGIDAEAVSEGEAAVNRYTEAMKGKTPFDAVLLDLTNRHGMGGIETMKRLSAIDPDVRAIITTGFSNDPVVTQFSAHGFAAALTKPFSRADLIHALERVL